MVTRIDYGMKNCNIAALQSYFRSDEDAINMEHRPVINESKTGGHIFTNRACIFCKTFSKT